MPCLHEILEKGVEQAASEFAKIPEGSTQPFNDDDSFEKQLEEFQKATQSKESINAIIEDSRRFI